MSYYSPSSPTGSIPGYGRFAKPGRSGCGCFTYIIIFAVLFIADKVYEMIAPESSMPNVPQKVNTIYLLQLTACNVWLRRFRYGPFEGVWRYLTRLGMK